MDGVNIQIEITQALNELDRELNLDTNLVAPPHQQSIKDIKVDIQQC